MSAPLPACLHLSVRPFAPVCSSAGDCPVICVCVYADVEGATGAFYLPTARLWTTGHVTAGGSSLLVSLYLLFLYLLSLYLCVRVRVSTSLCCVSVCLPLYVACPCVYLSMLRVRVSTSLCCVSVCLPLYVACPCVYLSMLRVRVSTSLCCVSVCLPLYVSYVVPASD
jgi:hypothetical protein